MRRSKLLVGLIFGAVAVSQQPVAITVQNLEGTPARITVEELTRLAQHPIKASEHGTPATFEGVLLSDVLAKVGVPFGEKLRGKALSQYLLVEAADGYRAIFALPELDPAFSEKRVYLVTKRDGKPLSAKE